MDLNTDMPAANDKVHAEFFAGIGLVRMGLERGGWRCGYANDIELKKYQMYADTFSPASEYHVEDVWNTQAALDRWPDSTFLATASFPCVDLSLAGHWKGFRGEKSSTYFGFLKILESLECERPKLVMLENVVGFLSASKGEDFKRAMVALADLGYDLDAIILDAKWFVPQSRPRLFVFGIHQSISQNLEQSGLIHSRVTNAWLESASDLSPLRPGKLVKAIDRTILPTQWRTLKLPTPKQSKYSLTEFIDLDDDQDWWDSSQVKKHFEMMEPPSRKRVEGFLVTGVTRAGTAYRRTRRGSTRTEVRFDMAGCLRTPKGGSARQIIVAVDRGQLKMRWMSAREYGRLQGAHAFKINVPDSQAMFGFGDAVCVPAIAWIDRHILSPIFDLTKQAMQGRATIAATTHH